MISPTPTSTSNRASQLFNPTAATTKKAKPVKPYAAPPVYVVERQHRQWPTERWDAVLQAYTRTRGEGYRTLNTCASSPLVAYHHCRLRLRRLKDNRIICEAKHHSLDSTKK